MVDLQNASMPNVYKALELNQTPHLIGINQAPGKIIMREVPVRERTMEKLFRAFCIYFHTPGNWTWDPGTGTTPPPEQVLDGDQRRGQCLALAKALALLAKTAWPHGLGLPSARIGDASKEGTYTGRYKKGFISTHPLGGILGLQPNVYDVPNLQISGFYSWSDHKVVPYNGRFYDPSYRQTYPALPSMVTYHVKQEDVRRRNVPGLNPNDVHDFVVVDDFSGSTRYFRYLTLTECNTRGIKFGALQGPWAGPQPPGTP